MFFWRTNRTILLFAAALLFFTPIISCGQNGDAAAVINGRTITETALDQEVEAFKRRLTSQGRSVPQGQEATLRSDVLDSLIRKETLLSAAEENNITPNKSEVDEEMDRVRNQFNSEDAFTQALEAQGYSPESLREAIEEDLIISELIEQKVLDDIDIPEQEIKDFYEQNSQYFNVSESVTASHILVQVGEEASQEQIDQARQKIENVKKELEEGADFAEVAKEKSEGPSASSGGDLGSFGRGQMVPPFEEAAFNLAPGELSDVVKTQFGYHIILVRDKTEARAQPLEEVKEDIVNHLKQSQSQDQINSYIAGLVEEANVERSEEYATEDASSETPQ